MTYWTLTIIAIVGIIVAMFPANKGNIPDVRVAALYSATSRIIWAMGLAWITFASAHNYGGLVSWFLSLKVWVPFSRLTYCAYLVHPIIIAIFYGSRHQTFDFSLYLIVSITLLTYFYFSVTDYTDFLGLTLLILILILILLLQLYFSISNICITYMVSLLVALFVEYPIVSLGQIMLL